MILAPTLTLSAGSGAAIVRPTFSRDFAGEKTLNNGTGPAITFTRASGATYFDANGVLQTASNDQPRFDHDPATGASRGLLIEEARTNSIRNSQAGGSTNGVIGSGGALPTNWSSVNAAANGITTEVIGTGTENGLAYIDIKVSGTPTDTTSVAIGFESTTQVVASNGQTWTSSAYVKLAAGATTNATINLSVRGRTSGGGLISGQSADIPIVPTSASINAQRSSATITFSSATVARAWALVLVDYTSGNAVDLTLRIAAPQLEQGAFPTSYIPTTTAAATRSADSAVVTPISSFYNQAEGTLFAEYSPVSLPLSGDFPRIVQVGNTTNNDNRNALTYWNNGGSLSHNISYFVATVEQLSKASTTGSVGQTFKVASGAAANSGHYAVNGSLVGSEDTSLSMGSASDFTHFLIGRASTGVVGRTAVHIRKIAYYPKRLSNTLLQQLTT